MRKKKPKVIVSKGMRRQVFRSFEDLLKDVEVRFMSPWTTEEFFEQAKDAEALIAFHEHVGEELLDHAPELKVVSRFGVGYDGVDVEACTKRGIYVTHTPGVLSRAVAELTMGLMLCLSRRIHMADRYVRTEWARPGRALLPLRGDLAGKTLGVIGLGRIGYEVARRAKGFDMNIVYYDKVRKGKAEEELAVRYLALDDLYKTSDFVTVHVPLLPETASMIGERELKLMKKTAYLLNLSRGPVVDEKALCKALKESWIAGAGLDVFTKEPLPSDSPLTKMENALLTAHIGGATEEARKMETEFAINEIITVLRGGIPENLANPEVLRTRTRQKI